MSASTAATTEFVSLCEPRVKAQELRSEHKRMAVEQDLTEQRDIGKHVFAWSSVLLAAGHVSVCCFLRALAQAPTTERCTAKRTRQRKATGKVSKRLVTAGASQG